MFSVWRQNMFVVWKLVGKFVGLGFLAVFIVVVLLVLWVKVPYFKTSVVTIRQNSMSPILNIGDVVMFRSGAGGYEVGEIVAYWHPAIDQLMVTHRVVDRSSTTTGYEYITKGDSSKEVDSYRVPEEKVVGRQVFVVPVVGKVWIYAKANPGAVGFVVVPVILILVGDGLAIWSEVRKFRRKKMIRQQGMVEARVSKEQQKRQLGERGEDNGKRRKKIKVDSAA